ncbi:MAG: hypothetical protein ACLUFI_02040 [Oscillospiraceae bacterium]
MNVLGLILGGLMLVDPLVSWLSARYLVSFYLILLGVDCSHSGLQQARLQKIECYAGGCSFRSCNGKAAAILPPLCRFDFCLLFGASDACKAASGVVN